VGVVFCLTGLISVVETFEDSRMPAYSVEET
jgi:hypothetical protein